MSTWQIKRIGDFADVVTGGTPRTSQPEYWGGDINWMSSGEVNDRRVYSTKKKITQLGLEKSNARLLPKDSVMIALAGQGKTRGMAAILKTEATCNQSLAAILPNPEYDSEFLYQVLVRKYRQIRSMSGGDGRSGLNLKMVKAIEIALPDLQTQRLIARVLMEADANTVLTQESIDHLTKLKKSTIQQLFTEGLGDREFTDSEIGKIPSGWKVSRFVEFCELQRGFDLSKSQRTKGEFPLVASNGIIDSHDLDMVKGPGVVTGRSGTIGRVFYIDKNFWPLNTTLYVKDFKGNDPKFVYYFLQWFNLSRFVSGTGVPTLNRNNVHNRTISYPQDRAEQKRIVEILDCLEKIIEQSANIKLLQAKVKEGLAQDLLTRAVLI